MRSANNWPTPWTNVQKTATESAWTVIDQYVILDSMVCDLRSLLNLMEAPETQNKQPCSAAIEDVMSFMLHPQQAGEDLGAWFLSNMTFEELLDGLTLLAIKPCIWLWKSYQQTIFKADLVRWSLFETKNILADETSRIFEFENKLKSRFMWFLSG